jgi:prepilin-type N-terminal cleavage/methylation domain-containing protein/prepilin-type processing-associated H-X9-DG protein
MSNVRSTNARGSGFTLVELLTVIAVLAIIITLLLPALARARKASETVRCINNMRQMGSAMMAFAARNEGRLPGGGQRNLPTNSSIAWQDIVNYECFNIGGYIPRLNGTTPSKSKLACPSVIVGPWSGSTRMYGINRWICGDNETSKIGCEYYIKPASQRNAPYKQVSASFNFTEYWLGAKVSAVRNPSTKYLVVESYRGGDALGGGEPISLDNTSSQPPGAASNGAYDFRHYNLKMNVVFVDGHVETIPFSPTAMSAKRFNLKS